MEERDPAGSRRPGAGDKLNTRQKGGGWGWGEVGAAQSVKGRHYMGDAVWPTRTLVEVRCLEPRADFWPELLPEAVRRWRESTEVGVHNRVVREQP